MQPVTNTAKRRTLTIIQTLSFINTVTYEYCKRTFTFKVIESVTGNNLGMIRALRLQPCFRRTLLSLSSHPDFVTCFVHCFSASSLEQNGDAFFPLQISCTSFKHLLRHVTYLEVLSIVLSLMFLHILLRAGWRCILSTSNPVVRIFKTYSMSVCHSWLQRIKVWFALYSYNHVSVDCSFAYILIRVFSIVPPQGICKFLFIWNQPRCKWMFYTVYFEQKVNPFCYVLSKNGIRIGKNYFLICPVKWILYIYVETP